jgi:hypothetical protein
LAVEVWIFLGIWSLEFEASASDHPSTKRRQVDFAKIPCTIADEARKSRPMKRSQTSRALVSAFLSAAFLWTLVLSVSPQLHERFHPDANRTEHSCAVTLVSSGSYDHVVHSPIVDSSIAVTQFAAIPALDSQWVQSPFLGASVFEHAPPALA